MFKKKNYRKRLKNHIKDHQLFSRPGNIFGNALIHKRFKIETFFLDRMLSVLGTFNISFSFIIILMFG